MALACAAPGAAPRSSTGPFNDTMLKVNSVGPFVPHSQDDLWTACGAYVDDADGDGILSSVCSENELSSMVSMVTSSVQQQQQRQQPESHHHQRRHSEVLASSGIHCNVPLPVSSFDSGSTGSHGSCTPPFSAGSPVTVLPPLPFSYPDDGKDQEGYVQFVNGFWPHQDHAYECGTVGENNFSSLLNELPLRPFNDVVDGGDVDLHGARGNDCRLVEISQQQQSSVSSHVSCQTSDNVSGSSRSGSSRTGIVDSSVSQEFIVRRDCGSDQQQLSAGSHSASQAISCSTNCSPSSPASTPGAAKPTTVPGQIESEVSPAAGHVRLSWTDHYWPTTSNGTPLVDTMFHSSSGGIPSTHQHLQLPQQIVNVFQRSANSQVPLTFHDADYVATCNQYRKTQLQDTAAPAVGGIDSCHGLKRPFSTMQLASSNTATSASTVGTTSSIATSASQSLLKHTTTSTSNHLQDAAALNALLYKSNHNNARSLSSAQSAQATHPAAANVGAPTAAAASSEDSQLMPPPKLRRRHGTATDPQSIAARTRRERFSDRIRLLQSLVPNGERLDTVSMLGHTLEYVRFLQHKVWQLYNGGDDASTSETDSESREKWKEFMDTTQVPIS